MKKDDQFLDEDDEFEDDLESQEDLDSNGNIKGLLKSFKTFCMRNKKLLLITLTIVAIIIVVIVAVGFMGQNNSLVDAGNIAVAEETTYSTENSTENSTETRSVEVVSEEVQSVTSAAEIVATNNSGDPQSQDGNNSAGNGAVVNASDLKTVGGNNTSNGIDVSSWTGDIDWNAVAGWTKTNNSKGRGKS